MRWCGRAALWIGALVNAGVWGCDPAAPEEPPVTGEIDPDDGFGGANHIFEAGEVSADRLEAIQSVSCLTERTTSAPAPSAIEFVIDVSGSMALAPDLQTDSKWETTQVALLEAVEDLAATTRVGAVFFPGKRTERHCTTDEGLCTPAEPLDRSTCVNLDAIVEPETIGPVGSDIRLAFEEAVLELNPAGGTPTHDALSQGLDELRKERGDGERFLILITDGQPTFLEGCTGSGNVTQPVDEQPIIDLIQDARSEGISTFIVGSPGSEENSGDSNDARPWLSRAAIAGFTAPEGCTEEGPEFCHFDLTTTEDFRGELEIAFDRILGRIKSCDIPVPDGPGKLELDPDALNVVIHSIAQTSSIIGKSSEQCYGEGWTYTKANESVRLCAEACDLYRESAMTEVELFFGCQAAPVPPPT